MSRAGQGFDTRRPDLRLTELARIALLDRRAILSAQDVNALVHGKWENPMLGLYGANLLLVTGEGIIQQLDVIRKNLRGLLGDHPDVAALDVRAGEPVAPVEVPPMLRVSWDALVAGTAKRDELIAADSLPGKIAHHLFGTGVWLTWRAKARKTKVASRASQPGRLGDRIDQLAAALASTATKTGRAELQPAGTTGLSPVGQSVVALACERAREAHARPAQKGRTPKLSERDVVEALGAPQSVVAGALADALETFGVTTG
jgi:hypothetical protein